MELYMGSLILRSCKLCFFQYFTFDFSVFEYFTIRLNFKNYWRSEAAVNVPTCLYLMQIYALNILLSLVNLSSEKMVLWVWVVLSGTTNHFFLINFVK